MNSRRNWTIAAAAAILCGAVLFQHSTAERDSTKGRTSSLPADNAAAAIPEKADIGYTAPSFSLTGLDGQTHSLEALRGKPVILNFWASWCGPCRDEAPSFVKLHKQYGDRLHVVAVNLTATDSLESAREFARTYGFTFPVPLDKDGEIAARYRIRPIPTTIFIDSRGIITDGVLGALEWDLLRDRALPLIEGTNGAG